MKRILAACVLLMAGAWASAQVNGQGGVYINGVLQTAVSWDYLHAGGISMTDPTSDVAPDPLLLKAANAWPGATTNTTGANTILAGGIGRRIYTVVDYSQGSMAGSTVTITANGTATVLTEGVEWTAATSNNATATSLAAAIDAVSGVSATASSAVVRIVPDVGAYSLTIAKSAADAGMTATSGTNGVVSVIGPESLELEHLKFLDGAGHFSGFKAQAQAADLTYTLPAAHGTGYLYDDGAGALAWSTPAGGANTALSNLASVAINAALTTGAGTAAALTASPPAQTASAQAGIAAGVTASDAVAGDTNVGAAAGGSVTVTAGDAARLTSGDANGGDIELVTGAGIGTGTNGVVKIPYVGGVFSPIQFGSTAANRLYLNNESQNILIWGGSGGVSVDAMNSNSYKTAAGWELWGYGGPFSVGKDFQFVWGPGTIYGSPDVGIVRGGAPGILKISDSSTGYGALSLDTNARVYADTVSLSDAAKTAVLDIAIADGEYIGGTLTYTITATDATDHQALTGIVGFSGVRKNGTPDTYHLTIAESASPVLAESAGASTLTDTWEIDAGTNVATISVTADSSLTTPTMTCRYQLTLNSANAVTKK